MASNAIIDIFGPHFRGEGQAFALMNDGRALDESAVGLEIAVSLSELDPGEHADEIIKLMKPFCRPFDITKARAALKAYRGGREDGPEAPRKPRDLGGMDKLAG